MKDLEEENTGEATEEGKETTEILEQTGNEGIAEPEKPNSPEKPCFSLLPRKNPSSVDSDDESSYVNVVTRVRPLNPSEESRHDAPIVNFPGNGGLHVESQAGKKSFAFNAVFEPGCSQKKVFENCEITKLLDMALDGYACTAFAFGQTGSGKSYTMTGPVTPETNISKHQDSSSIRHPDNYGLIQFSFAYLMSELENMSESTFSIRASYMEIYNEQVQDLLNPFGYDIVQVRWSKSSGFYVENLFVREIESLDELFEVLEDGMKNRSVAAHNVNEHSSRSHSILTVHLESETTQPHTISVTKRGKISFVDLAGSEKVKETGSTGDTLTEATNINRSLLTLGNCISALSDNKKKGGHIPFRDSKLTKLLADSLGGGGATLMIACVSPSSHNVSETLNTLRYAKRAKKIKNKPVIRMDPREELIMKLQREMNLIKQENVFLRNQLQFPQREKPKYPKPNSTGAGPTALPLIHPQQPRPNERPATENSLYGMLQEYMVENEALRNENQTLMTQHSNDEREFRIISRENDRLSEKLEDLQRLVLSSPLISDGFSRTNSGHSYLSHRSYDTSLTPISQTFHPKQHHLGPGGSHFPNYAINPQKTHPSKHHTHHPNFAYPHHENGIDLPPLKGSMSHPRRQENGYIGNQGGNVADQRNKSKWDKARSYAQQIHIKKQWHRTANHHGNQEGNKKTRRYDVMSDFPLHDLNQQRHEEQLHGHQLRHLAMTSSEQLHGQGHPIQPNRGFPQDGKYIEKPLRREQMRNDHPAGGALPKEAYKTRDLSPKGFTKELSATSLRKMNNKMRREMFALEKQIHFETRKKLNGS